MFLPLILLSPSYPKPKKSLAKDIAFQINKIQTFLLKYLNLEFNRELYPRYLIISKLWGKAVLSIKTH